MCVHEPRHSSLRAYLGVHTRRQRMHIQMCAAEGLKRSDSTKRHLVVIRAYKQMNDAQNFLHLRSSTHTHAVLAAPEPSENVPFEAVRTPHEPPHPVQGRLERKAMCMTPVSEVKAKLP